jgi:hypothetical protein
MTLLRIGHAAKRASRLEPSRSATLTMGVRSADEPLLKTVPSDIFSHRRHWFRERELFNSAIAILKLPGCSERRLMQLFRAAQQAEIHLEVIVE